MKSLLLFYISLLFCIIPSVSSQAQETATKKLSGKALFGSLRARQIGPAVTSGRVASLDAVKSSPEIIYVGSASGGVWKSNSGGNTFRPVFDDHTQAIGKVTIDQAHPDTVWVGTGEPWTRNSISIGDGVYKTTNGGTSWQHMGLKNTERIADIIVHPKDPNTVYVAALGHLWDANEERGIYRTTDGGENWDKVFYIDENTGCTDLDIDPENPDIMYASMWSFRRWPWTFDSGFTGGSGFFKSTDGGKNWKEVRNGLPDGKLGRMAIAVSPANGKVVYVSVEAEAKEDKGLYKSTDGGSSFTKVNNDFNMTVRPFYFSNMIPDPKDEDVLYKCGLFLSVTEDGGDRFRTASQAVHSDIHDVWVNPNNPKHVLIGTDGGVYESKDRGYTFSMFMNLPLAQFYRISVDMDEPYNIYGGLQDNGSWMVPSRKSGGITNSDWKATFGGDGFYSFRHPTDENVIYAEYQGGNLVRYNKKTGRAKEIQPYPENSEDKYRFNWNTPIALSPNNPEKIYFAAQYLFSSTDRGDTWKIISPDLTTNDPKKQEQEKSGGLSIDNSTAENHCTIYAVAESPKNENVIWVGTDDGNLQITKNGGKKWKNVVENIDGLPANTWVTDVEPGHFDEGTAYVTFDGHRTGDTKTYLYKTTDYGKTWTNLVTEDLAGYSLSFCEDLVNPNLLFLGTEFGLYISVDAGANWARFENNVPKVGVRDMVIHPRDHALVMGTHGRGAIILDDITPLRQIKPEILGEKVAFLETEPTILRDPGAGGGWFGGDATFVGSNPNSAAKIVYYMNKRHTFGKMFIEVYDQEGNLFTTLPAGKSGGINIVEMPTALKKPKSAPTDNRQALFGTLFGPNLDAGKYKVRLVKGKESYETTFELKNDPNSLYSDSDLAAQRKATMDLYKLTEDLAHVHFTLTEAKDQANKLAEKDGALKGELGAFARMVETYANDLVFIGGDGYVDSGEKISEKISSLYRQVSSYPGKPSTSQLERIASLVRDFAPIKEGYTAIVTDALNDVNAKIKAAGLSEIKLTPFDKFKKMP